MNKQLTPLEALKRLAGDHRVCYLEEKISDVNTDYDIIATALKDYEEQNKTVNLIKDVIQFGRTLPEIKPNDKNGFDILQKVGLRVQRDIENEERKQFRDWVLKTCFPKELVDYEKKLKVLEIIKEYVLDLKYILYCFENNIDYAEYVEKELWIDAQDNSPMCPMKQEEFDLLKEELGK